MKHKPKTVKQLRNILFDEIEQVRAGKRSLQESRAISNLASKIIDSIRVEIQYGRLLEVAKNKPIEIAHEIKK